ncbi:hypothetical protein GEU84_019595 [Fertoebacter nigrum]|uniref:DUF2259 domain-containing protein n=1 Tax=Fertoeibacter niger TaxID=2656921 RepID=A0A8X8H3D9_9RHOB|nr:hypothetical protein [Fertoeibacter niger]NUB46601.1 hypothetical protein [Fertoeibacter niger]
MIRAMQVLALLMAVCGGAARAEVVFVNAAFEEVGNGWLFGSRNDSSCWIALPWHVVGTMDTTTAPAFAFRDQSGRSGETAQPIRVSAVPGALQAAGMVDDLAFARVVAGRAEGDCNSRLGLPGQSYVDALARSRALNVIHVQEGATVTFAVDRFRSTTDEAQGSRFLVRPLNPADRTFFRGGLSGSIVFLDWEGNPLPAAMILEVRKDEGDASVLRFDLVRAAFELIEAAQNSRSPEPLDQPGQIRFEILHLLAVPLEASALLSEIAPGGCWQVTPPPGKRVVEVVLQIKDNVQVSAIRLRADPACGPATALTIEMNRGDGWTTLNNRCMVGASASICRVGAKGPLKLRFRAVPAQGVVGLSEIYLQ